MATNMKVIIAGSRQMVPTEKHVKILDKHKHIPVKHFPADWDKHGKGAGHARNKQMAEYANGLIAFIYNNSKGTTNMIKQAKEKKLWIEIIRCKLD